MYEPCVRNRRVAPREDRYSLKRQIFFFNNRKKKGKKRKKERKKIEKKSNGGQNDIFLILQNLRILFDNRNTIVNCRYSLIASIYVVAMEVTSFSMTLQPLKTSQLLIFSLLYVDYRLRFQESSIVFREIVSIVFFFTMNLFCLHDNNILKYKDYFARLILCYKKFS